MVSIIVRSGHFSWAVIVVHLSLASTGCIFFAVSVWRLLWLQQRGHATRSQLESCTTSHGPFRFDGVIVHFVIGQREDVFRACAMLITCHCVLHLLQEIVFCGVDVHHD